MNLKKLFLLIILSFPAIVFGQKIYVSSLEEECGLPVFQYLSGQGKDVIAKRQDADYIIDCVLVPKGRGNCKGYLTIIDAKTGNEVARSKEIHKSVSAHDGLHLGKKIFEALAKKHLPELLEKIPM